MEMFLVALAVPLVALVAMVVVPLVTLFDNTHFRGGDMSSDLVKMTNNNTTEERIRSLSSPLSPPSSPS